MLPSINAPLDPEYTPNNPFQGNSEFATMLFLPVEIHSRFPFRIVWKGPIRWIGAIFLVVAGCTHREEIQFDYPYAYNTKGAPAPYFFSATRTAELRLADSLQKAFHADTVCIYHYTDTQVSTKSLSIIPYRDSSSIARMHFHRSTEFYNTRVDLFVRTLPGEMAGFPIADNIARALYRVEEGKIPADYYKQLRICFCLLPSFDTLENYSYGLMDWNHPPASRHGLINTISGDTSKHYFYVLITKYRRHLKSPLGKYYFYLK